MDYIFIAFVVLGALKGRKKGGIGILISCFSLLFAVIIAYFLCKNGVNILEKTSFFSRVLPGFFEEKINKMTSATFSSLNDLLDYLKNTNFGNIFAFLAKKMFTDGNFVEKSTLGSCLSKPICLLIEKMISFVTIYFITRIILRFAEGLIGKLLGMFRLSKANRIVGFGIGIFQGVVSFVLLFLILSVVANISMNEQLIEFTKTGTISNLLINLQIEKAINIFV